MKEDIKIPVYYYENNEGHKIIDKVSMKKEFNKQIKYLYLSTKKGSQETLRERLKNKKKITLIIIILVFLLL